MLPGPIADRDGDRREPSLPRVSWEVMVLEDTLGRDGAMVVRQRETLNQVLAHTFYGAFMPKQQHQP